MVIASFPAGPLAANCYVLGTGDDDRCVVIDPGMDAAERLDTACQELGLRPSAVLLTHGHFDHVADAATVADRYGAGCWIGPADRPWLTDPLAALTPDFHPLVADYADPATAREPATMLTAEPATDGQFATLDVAGLRIELIPAPGHTPGATLFRTPYHDESGRYDLLFTGDVLFAGTVGRTDLPGGDQPTMDRTLSSTVLSPPSQLPDETVVLPGHGSQTTLGRERAGNPYLLHL
ncbi:MBL fold metallo-hydrolase [Microlunatus soli]|uniref:MBL fold metallo-hydrolase n=1 Tax=Microlunatus soli TaxID=630515 RepID=UPI000B8A1D13|nr:MBL fold metallo-hydrolase [Microlunatus soli]